jgi:hypothetical protein
MRAKHTMTKIVIPAVRAKKKRSMGGIFFMSHQRSKTHAKRAAPALFISMLLMHTTKKKPEKWPNYQDKQCE